MHEFRLLGLFAVIPTAVLLTISFFVLFALRKIETEGLKAFGYIIATLLWIGAALVLSVGLYAVASGRQPMCPMMYKMMEGKKHYMMKDKAPAMMPAEMEKEMIKR